MTRQDAIGTASALLALAVQAMLGASLAAALTGCTPVGPSTIEPPVPLSNVTPEMLNPDGTFKKNGLAPVDPSEQI